MPQIREPLKILFRSGAKDDSEKFLPLVKLLQRRGDDVTVYEWKRGEAPVQVEKPKIEYVEKETVKIFRLYKTKNVLENSSGRDRFRR